MTEIRLKYGNGELTARAPDGALAGSIGPATPEPDVSADEIVRRALDSPIGSLPLADLASGARTASILIPGKTRVAATRTYVPALVDELERAGVPGDGIEVFLATGTHEHHLECDVASLLGDETASRVRTVFHDCFDESGLEQLGTTSFGTPVLVNRRVLDSDVRILTGRIVPHYFAGFSGGRKALIPGVAGFRTIKANHRLTLDPVRGLHPNARPCVLDGNPIHLDMVEGMRMAGPMFCLNTLLDTSHRLVDAVAGDAEAAHVEGSRRAGRLHRTRLDAAVDAVITSAGGSPFDCNFMQSLKAVMNVRDAVRPGGAILWVAECPFGIDPDFLRWAAIESDAELESAVRERYNLKGHNTLMLRHLTRKADVALCSGLPEADVRAMGFHPVTSLAEGLDWLRDRLGAGFSYVVAPHANVTCATVGPD